MVAVASKDLALDRNAAVLLLVPTVVKVVREKADVMLSDDVRRILKALLFLLLRSPTLRMATLFMSDY